MLIKDGKVVWWITQSSFNSLGEMVRKLVDNSRKVVSELFFIMQIYGMFITSATAGNKLRPRFLHQDKVVFTEINYFDR